MGATTEIKYGTRWVNFWFEIAVFNKETGNIVYTTTSSEQAKRCLYKLSNGDVFLETPERNYKSKYMKFEGKHGDSIFLLQEPNDVYIASFTHVKSMGDLYMYTMDIEQSKLFETINDGDEYSAEKGRCAYKLINSRSDNEYERFGIEDFSETV